jgi:hypothetical protein
MTSFQIYAVFGAPALLCITCGILIAFQRHRRFVRQEPNADKRRATTEQKAREETRLLEERITALELELHRHKLVVVRVPHKLGSGKTIVRTHSRPALYEPARTSPSAAVVLDLPLTAS